jgi:hypothetical protein
MKTPIVRSTLLLTAIALMAAVPASPSRSGKGGGTLTISARPLRGTESLLVQGTAPAGAPVFLRLTATFDRDVPAVVVDRMRVVADADNGFTAVLPYTPASEHIAILSVQASMAGLSPAIACCFAARGPRTSSSSSSTRP